MLTDKLQFSPSALFRYACWFTLLIGACDASATGYGFDSFFRPGIYTQHLTDAGLGMESGMGTRVRGVRWFSPEAVSDTSAIADERAGLRALRDHGMTAIVLLRWDPSSWSGGVRPGGGHRMPLDLREAYDRGRWLGETYGDLVDVWEIDNEPDIGYGPDNPETYAAFLKATYLGLKQGVRDGRPAESRPPRTSALSVERPYLRYPVHRKHLNNNGVGRPYLKVGECGRVIMAPLALPPGPYLERLWDNGLASYTDGFNYHYYGYAEDFTGVYRQFEDAVARLGSEQQHRKHENTLTGLAPIGDDSNTSRKLLPYWKVYKKSLPVFITEYGYGLLDADARNTVEGRVHQWRWFADVVRQVHRLRPEGPMAFFWNPYYEADLNEFGLTTKSAMAFQPSGRDNQSSEPGPFTPSDFGEKHPQSWMWNIGKKIGEAQATPALAYLWDYASRHPYRPRDWTVSAMPASPVVIDFIPGTGMTQLKSSGGYLLTGSDAHQAVSPTRVGQGAFILYNFSSEEMRGRLEISGEGMQASPTDCDVVLAGGERRVVTVDLGVHAEVFAGRTCRAAFVPTGRSDGSAVFASRLFPGTEGMTSRRLTDFNFEPDVTSDRREVLRTRPLAHGEPAMFSQSRWLVTDGVRVEEIGSLWRFYINHLPPDPLRPAMVELPLPEKFEFCPGSMLLLDRRKKDPATEGWSGDAASQLDRDDRRLIARSGKAGDVMDVYFRTANGNLYQTYPRLSVGREWREYVESADNFTMAFFGRAALPWRFSENRPVSLVFFLRPSQLPAIFEVRDARIVKVAR